MASEDLAKSGRIKSNRTQYNPKSEIENPPTPTVSLIMSD